MQTLKFFMKPSFPHPKLVVSGPYVCEPNFSESLKFLLLKKLKRQDQNFQNWPSVYFRFMLGVWKKKNEKNEYAVKFQKVCFSLLFSNSMTFFFRTCRIWTSASCSWLPTLQTWPSPKTQKLRTFSKYLFFGTLGVVGLDWFFLLHVILSNAISSAAFLTAAISTSANSLYLIKFKVAQIFQHVPKQLK